jgi:hypothetical protein
MTRPGPEQREPYAPGPYVLGAAAAPPATPPPAQAAPAAPAPSTGRPYAVPEQAVAGTVATSPLTGTAAGVPAQATATVAATARATATATFTGTASRAVAAAAPAPESPPRGTVYGTRPFDGADPPGLNGRLPRLRIGSHVATLGGLAQLSVASPGAGLILGADRDRNPVPVRLFRAEPTRTALVGGAWAGQLLAFRALALGVRVVVLTVEPALWHGMGERATGRSDRMGVLAGERPIAVTGTAQQPILVVYDLGLTGPTSPNPLGPWQTQLTILRQLDEAGMPVMQESTLVMLQRLGGTEAALAGAALRLSSQSVRLLQVMEDDMLALLGGGADRYVWLAQTEIERRQMGAPRR